MIKQIANIVRDVKVCLDMNREDAQLLADEDEDTLKLNELIRSKIVEAVRRAHLEAPTHMLEGGHDFGGEDGGVAGGLVLPGMKPTTANDAVYWESGDYNDGRGEVLLPDDFMRLVVFEMTDWERAVYTAIDPGDPEYERQRSRRKGIRGNYQRPVCAIGIRPGGKVLEFYASKNQGARVRRAIYIPEPSIDRDGGIWVSRDCYQGIVYLTSALTMASMGEGSTDTYMVMYKSALGIGG